MVNRARGETEVNIGGKNYCLRMTLGALAEIEEALEIECLDDLGSALEKPRASHLIAVLGALMRGGGCDISDEKVASLPITDITQLGNDIGRAMSAGSPEPDEKPVKKTRRAKPRGAGGKK